ncbi:MAG: hypothetical protein ACRCYO_13415 [Bacteroidia bacterium]
MEKDITGIENISFGIATVIQIVIFIVGIVAIYYTNSGKIERIDNCLNAYIERNDVDKKRLELELDSLEQKVDINNSEVLQKIGDIKDLIHLNHIALLTAINNNK